jgi:hypothetical protein
VVLIIRNYYCYDLCSFEISSVSTSDSKKSITQIHKPSYFIGKKEYDHDPPIPAFLGNTEEEPPTYRVIYK